MSDAMPPGVTRPAKNKKAAPTQEEKVLKILKGLKLGLDSDLESKLVRVHLAVNEAMLKENEKAKKKEEREAKKKEKEEREKGKNQKSYSESMEKFVKTIDTFKKGNFTWEIDKKSFKEFRKVNLEIQQELYDDAAKELMLKKKSLLQDINHLTSEEGKNDLLEINNQLARLEDMRKQGKLKKSEEVDKGYGIVAGAKKKISDIPRRIAGKVLSPIEFLSGVSGEEIYDVWSAKRREKKALNSGFKFGSENKGFAGGMFPKEPLLSRNPTISKVLKTNSAALGSVLLFGGITKIIKLLTRSKESGTGDGFGDGLAEGLGDSLMTSLLSGGGVKGLIAKATPIIAPIFKTLAKALPWVAIGASVLSIFSDGLKGAKMPWNASGVSKTLGAAIAGTGKGFEGAFKNMGKWALMGAGIGSLIFPGVGTLAGGLIGAAFGGILGFIGGENLAKFFDKIGKGVATLAAGAWKGIKDIGNWVYDNVLTPVGSAIGTALYAAWTGLTKVPGWIWDNFFVPAGSAVTSLVSSAWSGITDGAKWLYDNVLTPVGSSIGNFFTNAWSFITNGAKGMWEGATTGLSNAWDWLQGNLLGPVSAFAAATIANAVDLGKDFVKDPLGTYNKVADKVLGLLGPIGEMAKNMKDDAIAELKKFISDPTGTVKSYFKSISEAVDKFMKDPSGFVRDALNSFVNGFKTFIQPITDYFGYMGQLAGSKDFVGIGKFLVGGKDEDYANYRATQRKGEFVSALTSSTDPLHKKYKDTYNEYLKNGKEDAANDYLERIRGNSDLASLPKFHTGGKSYKEQVALLKKDEVVLNPQEASSHNAEQMKINKMLLEAIQELTSAVKNNSGGKSIVSQTVINRYSPTSIMNALGAT